MRLLFAAMLFGLALTGCGRKGAPEPPGPAPQVFYPHQYPSQ